MGEQRKRISELIDIEKFQRLQDECSRLTGLSFVTVDYQGNPVTKYSGFTEHCLKVREYADLMDKCAKCDAHGGLNAAIGEKPHIYICHAGLVDFALPLIMDGSYVGALLGGQARVREEEIAGLECVLNSQSEKCKQDPEILSLHESMDYIPLEKIESSINIILDLFHYLVKEKENQKMEQKLQQTEKELAKIKASIAEEGISDRKDDQDLLTSQVGGSYFYFVMNILARLSYEEKAGLTEQVIYDYTDMSRYASLSHNDIATLGEELRYIEAMLRIQKVWMQDKLDFSVSVDESFWGAPCPWMLLHPIIERMLMQKTETEERTSISIEADRKDDMLLINMTVRGNGQTVEQWMSWLHSPHKRHEANSLYEVNYRLKSFLGSRIGIEVFRQDKVEGVLVQFSLALD